MENCKSTKCQSVFTMAVKDTAQTNSVLAEIHSGGVTTVGID